MHPGVWPPGFQRSEFRVNGARLNDHLSKLSAFGANAEGGVSRVAFSEADLAGRAFVMKLMRDAGLDPRIDYAGNLIGRRAGNTSGVKPLMLGSHIDSVPMGGNYDGPVGVMAAIEVAHTTCQAVPGHDNSQCSENALSSSTPSCTDTPLVLIAAHHRSESPSPGLQQSTPIAILPHPPIPLDHRFFPHKLSTRSPKQPAASHLLRSVVLLI